MRFRNPVEYLSNPPEQVLSVDEFFRLQCIRARSLIMDLRLGRLFIWRERGVWLVRYSCLRPHLQEEYVGSLGGQGSKLSEAVESAFANKYAKDYVKSVLAPRTIGR